MMKYWVENYYDADFKPNEELLRVLLDFIDNVVTPTGNAKFAQAMKSILSRKRNPKQSEQTESEEPVLEKTGSRASLIPSEEPNAVVVLAKRTTFLEMDTLAIALQMCVIEQELYQ